MYNSKRACFLPILLTIVMNLSAQQKRLNIGDSLPSFSFENLLNYSSGALRFSDLKGKVILIDFWNHHCVPCFTAFPKLDSIQKKFSDKIQIILVNKEGREATIAFFKKWKKIKMPNLPMITGDTTLCNTFPSKGLPYTVWIDQKGVVKHFSGGSYTTVENVNDFIDGKTIDIKNSTLPKTAALSIESAQKDTRFSYYSSISLCLRSDLSGGSRGSKTSDGQSIRLAETCASAIKLITTAFEEGGKRKFAAYYSLDIKFKDSSRWISPKDVRAYDRWRDSNFYNFELLVPLAKAEDRWKYMQQDLLRFFPLQAWVEYRKMPSVVLKVIDGKKIPKGNGTPVNEWDNLIYGDVTGERLRFHNLPFSFMVSYVHGWFISKQPFFVEGNFEGSVSVDVRAVSAYPPKLDLLAEDLSRYGLQLSMEERSVPVLVIRDK